MADINEDPVAFMTPRRSETDLMALDDSLLTHSDHLMSFLETDFDTEMELVALDDEFHNEPTTCGNLESESKRESHGNANIDMEMEELVDDGYSKQEEMSMAMQSDVTFASVTPQYPPASAIPNYWNVLNQGMAPMIVPPAPAVPPQRKVHIAPKPEARHTLRSRAVQMTEDTYKMLAPQTSQQIHKTRQYSTVRASTPVASRVVSCRCTGGCRNGRCACVKDGGMCGASCRCTSCKNPFSMVKAAGADIDALLKDDCFMHNVLKTRDMMQRLQELVAVPCCDRTVKVIDCVQGYTCETCKRRYDFSWCTNKLLGSERTPRNHCAICKRCCDHRDAHCNNCGRCYFAGVAASLPCPCKEAMSHKKRRESAAKEKAEVTEEEAEGECCIM
ncbi:unnamed protein product [Peronospora belbahrii]|uniref:Tesmin/TSO1-like CXC domain-containing protein n=1 Tax=Peronospora belbahrii TaxID=622444 RepID=A0AAU9KWH2_9STRA|nr:unnamed protein product [Peronospora belbahrii]CAH0519023.1 unnamed protein product [Peronospora belbahrii]